MAAVNTTAANLFLFTAFSLTTISGELSTAVRGRGGRIASDLPRISRGRRNDPDIGHRDPARLASPVGPGHAAQAIHMPRRSSSRRTLDPTERLATSPGIGIRGREPQ